MRRPYAVLASMTALFVGTGAFGTAGCCPARCRCAAAAPGEAPRALRTPPFVTARAARVVELDPEPAPKELADIGRVSMLLFTPPPEGETIAKDTVVFWEFSADKSKVAVVPGEWIRPKNDATERFKLVDVVRVAPNVSRFRLVYDVFEDPADKTKSRRAELLYEGAPKRLPQGGGLPAPWEQLPKRSTPDQK